MDLVADFLISPQRNAWLEYSDKRVYVRKAHHCHLGLKKVISTFDIASIEVYKTHQGTFSRWLDELTMLLRDKSFDAIFIESVLNDNFAAYLRRKGLYEANELANNNFFLML